MSVLLSIRVLSSSCLLRLSLFSISDPTLTLVSPPPPPLSMSSPSSVFGSASQFNGDPSAWDVGSVTTMYASECTTVHPCCVVSSSCLLSRLHLSLSSISDPTHSPLLLLLLLLSRCPPSPSSVFRYAGQFNGDLSAWNVGSVTYMNQSECTTVHPCVVFLMSPPSLSLFHF